MLTKITPFVCPSSRIKKLQDSLKHLHVWRWGVPTNLMGTFQFLLKSKVFMYLYLCPIAPEAYHGKISRTEECLYPKTVKTNRTYAKSNTLFPQVSKFSTELNKMYFYGRTAELKVELYAKTETGPPYPTYLRHRECDFLCYLKLLWRVNSVKPSRASSQVRWLRCKYMKF